MLVNFFVGYSLSSEIYKKSTTLTNEEKELTVLKGSKFNKYMKNLLVIMSSGIGVILVTKVVIGFFNGKEKQNDEGKQIETSKNDEDNNNQLQLSLPAEQQQNNLEPEELQNSSNDNSNSNQNGIETEQSLLALPKKESKSLPNIETLQSTPQELCEKKFTLKKGTSNNINLQETKLDITTPKTQTTPKKVTQEVKKEQSKKLKNIKKEKHDLQGKENPIKQETNYEKSDSQHNLQNEGLEDKKKDI